MTILLIEQNAMAALQISDYGYVLETGRVVLEAPGNFHHLRAEENLFGES